MPYNWTPDTEKALLLAAIQEADLKPSKTVWQNVAASLGGGLTAGAVSQKFNKIKTSVAASAPVTPVKKNKTAKPKGSGSGNRSGGGTKSKQAPTDITTDDDDVTLKVEDEASDEMRMENVQGLSTNSAETASKKVKLEGKDADSVVGSVNGNVGIVNLDGDEDDDNTDDV